MNKKVRKAVFPAAGLGTRFLPATKAIPKEMLALVDKPIIQYGVEEALAAGIEHHRPSQVRDLAGTQAGLDRQQHDRGVADRMARG